MDRISVLHSRPVWLQLTENWLYHQCKYLDDSIEVHVVCKSTENIDQFRLENIHIMDAPSFCHRILDAMAWRLGIHICYKPFLVKLREIDPFVLHSHFGHMAWDEMFAARKAGVSQIATFYGHDVNRLPSVRPVWKDRYLELFENTAMILCEGTHMAGCIRALGCPSERIRVHHLGIDTASLSFKPRVWERGQKLRVLMAASFREKKGFPVALQALAEVRKNVDLDVIIIGDSDGEMRSEREKKNILKTIDNFKLNDIVRLMGFQPHQTFLEEAYASHIFLSPSIVADDGDTEGGAPVSIIEMAATGMPVVATKHCDIPEVIEHKKTGWLGEENDVESLVHGFLWLMEHNSLWHEFGEKARAHIEKEYNVIEQGRRLSHIYHHLLV